MRKILYIQQYFKTPNEAGSTRSYWISRELLKNGFKVVVVCQANPRAGSTQQKLTERYTVDGIEVVSIKNSYSNDMGAVRRIISFLRFMFLSLFYVLKENEVDLVFASSTPLTIAFPALLRKFFRRTKFVFEVRDLWPEAPIQLGFIRNRLLIKFLRWFEKTTYRAAEHVITLSPGMQEGVAKYVPKEKTSMIPNMAKIDCFWDRERNKGINERFGLLPDSFKVIYFGTMGVANGIDYLIRAVKLLESTGSDNNLEFVFVGEGVKKKDLLRIKGEVRQVKISVLDRQPMNVISELVNNSDVTICTFSDIPILKTNSPNKFFDALSAGRPSIVNSDGWTKEIVETHDCGFYVDRKNPQEIVEKILLLCNDQDLKIRMGLNARKVAETFFDKSILCRQVVDVLSFHSQK